MTEDFLKKLHTAARDLHLSTENKSAVKAHLVQFMHDQGVVRGEEFNRHLFAQRSILTRILHIKPMPIVVIVAIVALLGGGTSFAAQSALPGDALYAVKNVNESVAAVLRFSAEARADYQSVLAARRLAEAAALAERGELTDELRADIEARFERHAEVVQSRIEEIRTEGDERTAADVASRFEARLRADEQLFGRIRERSASAEEDVRPIAERVTSIRETVVELRVGLETDIVSREDRNGPEMKTAAEGKIGTAENAIAAARAYMAAKKDKIEADVFARAEVQLKEAEDLVVRAKELLANGEFAQAFNLGNAAIREVHEVREFLQARIDYRIDGEDREIDRRGRENGDENERRGREPNRERELEPTSVNIDRSGTSDGLGDVRVNLGR